MIKLSKVDSSFQSLLRRLNQAQKRVNMDAAARTKKGEYDAAKALMDIGTSLKDYVGRAEAFADEWRRLSKAIRVSAKANKQPAQAIGTSKPQKRTPAWKFCPPILRLLVTSGGSLDHVAVLRQIESGAVISLTEKDNEKARGQGTPRWYRAVERAYRLAQREGWIERARDTQWKITPAGRAIAGVPESSKSHPASA